MTPMGESDLLRELLRRVDSVATVVDTMRETVARHGALLESLTHAMQQSVTAISARCDVCERSKLGPLEAQVSILRDRTAVETTKIEAMETGLAQAVAHVQDLREHRARLLGIAIGLAAGGGTIGGVISQLLSSWGGTP